MCQTVWIADEGHSCIDEILRVKIDDIKATYNNKDLKEELNKNAIKKCIGFKNA